MSDDRQTEYGDFQTPPSLAHRCCLIARAEFGNVGCLVEPTCGKGSFLAAGGRVFDRARLEGYEIDQRYRRDAREELRQTFPADRWRIRKQDVFQCDWSADRRKHAESVLYIGNPPWVTNSQLGALGSGNRPAKSNVNSDKGLDALTGRSNFDIAESILLSLLEAMKPDQDALAMLVKTSTARRVAEQAWRRGMRFSHASIRRFDASHYFGISADACLFMLKRSLETDAEQICRESESLDDDPSAIAFGWYRDRLVSEPQEAEATTHLSSPQDDLPEELIWRSGVKHDLSNVLELFVMDNRIKDADGNQVDIENDRVFPLAKGSDVANGRTNCDQRRILITQRAMSECSEQLRDSLPKTWDYLEQNADRFAGRKSSIYRNRDRYALFGIGPYTFAPWKVAICGFYKRLGFTILHPIDDRPVVVDDTCYFLPLRSPRQAEFVLQLLESPISTKYFQARVFWDSKRPITAKLLRGLSMEAVAGELGLSEQFGQVMDVPVSMS